MTITPLTPVYAPDVRRTRDRDDIARRVTIHCEVATRVDQDRDLGDREIAQRIRHAGPSIDPRDRVALLDLAAYCQSLVERIDRAAA